ncbi:MULTISPECIES: hypothetical protein [Methylorubrum]|uniref:Uncharacterized protein n=1 Tax=Methylorubrum thiocyanatum TaxID=47958 RepID=A0AA40S5W9_9HYPH|nr:hypothetical protein [Methylorubrum thiocyanatum]MBA8915073.1 hypothetical protein [Methylorubrum thiocyanatum]GJE79477.1 hypothetical protein CJNNKLLH_0803 [Methylorubrum thiocyanatum]
MARPTSLTARAREAILDAWAAGRTAVQIAVTLGLPAWQVRNAVSLARRRGAPRAALRNAGAAWGSEPVVYSSSRAYLDASLARIRRRTQEWQQSEMGRRMAAVAVPPAEAPDA